MSAAPVDASWNASDERRAWWVVALLTSAALAVRLWGRDFLLPHYAEPDRYLAGQIVYLWAGGTLSTAPVDFWWYPALVSTLLSWTPAPEVLALASVEEHWQRALVPIIRTRTFVAIVSAFIVPLTYVLARRFYGRGASLFAAALLATSLLHVTFSTQARLHAVEGTAALTAVLAAMRMAARPGLGSYLLAGVGAAFAIGTLQNGVFVLPALGIAHLVRVREGSDGFWSAERKSAGHVALLVVPVALTFGLLYPYFRTQERPDQRQAYTDVTVRDGSVELGPQRLPLERFDGSGFGHMVAYLWWNDPTLLILAGFGAVVLVAGRVAFRRGEPRSPPDAEAAQRRRMLWIALAYAVPHGLVLGSYRNTWGRFLLPMLPYVACLAAAAGAFASQRLGGTRKLTWVAALLLALPTAGVLKLASLRSSPDTFELAAEWIDANVPPDQAVGVTPGMFLPLLHDDVSLAANRSLPQIKLSNALSRKIFWYEYQNEMPPGARDDGRPIYMLHFPRRADDAKVRERAETIRREQGVRYVAIELSQRMDSFPRLRAGLHALIEGAKVVAEWQPRQLTDPPLPWLDYQDQPNALWRTLSQYSLGPRIQILELAPLGSSSSE